MLSDKSVQLEAEHRLFGRIYFWIHYLHNLMLGIVLICNSFIKEATMD